MMDTKVVKIGSAFRNNPNNNNNNHGKAQELIPAVQPALHVRASVGTLIPTVYFNIDMKRLAKHSETGAKVLSEVNEKDVINGDVTTIILPTDRNAVTAGGLHYVLNVVNRTDPERRPNLRLGENLIFGLEIWAAVKALDLTAPQGRYRHDLLNKLSGTFPDAEALKKSYMFHQSDPGVYSRTLTTTAKHIVNGTLDIVSIEQYLGVTVETMLSRDLKACITRVKNHAEHTAALDRQARHKEKMWQLKNGLRPASEREVHQLTGRNKQ